MNKQSLPVPDFFDASRVGEIWKVDYAARADQANDWARQHNLEPASVSKEKISLLLVDVQNTFCIPDFELFVAGRSGRGAVEDNIRLCEFIYRNLARLSHITATLDTHQSQQIFHPMFFVDPAGKHPAPYTDIHAAEIRNGTWSFNPALAPNFQIAPEYGQQMMLHYADELERKGKYALTIWPYHAMLGGIGHALVPAVEEAIFFYSIARISQPDFEIKGSQPFTENYSVIGPEVLAGPMGETLGARNPKFIQHLQSVDRLYIAGQAKSHCVAWTVSDLLEDIQAADAALAKKVYLLEDCSSAVVVPGVVDHTDAANAAFARFAKSGMQIVKSTDTI
jgi:nicotinamidase-related amidase